MIINSGCFQCTFDGFSARTAVLFDTIKDVHCASLLLESGEGNGQHIARLAAKGMGNI